jgi:hypothetical protein
LGYAYIIYQQDFICSTPHASHAAGNSQTVLWLLLFCLQSVSMLSALKLGLQQPLPISHSDSSSFVNWPSLIPYDLQTFIIIYHQSCPKTTNSSMTLPPIFLTFTFSPSSSSNQPDPLSTKYFTISLRSLSELFLSFSYLRRPKRF